MSDESAEPRRGHERPTGPAPLTLLTVVGLVVGWSLRPLAVALDRTAPIVTWLQPGVLFFVAALLAAVAWFTWRALQQQRTYLEPVRAVNRLVLARACAYVGALVAGAYAGYAVTWLGIGVDFAGPRVWRSAAAALAGVLMIGAALALERACRVRPPDETP